jgi:organic hydroperoxide reductase OsmC/OhrA
MAREHRYEVALTWTGDRGRGTADYGAYGREHRLEAAGKPALEGSSDPAFRGDPTRWNPEELLVASLSACHMLWYLHLAADAGVVVLEYVDGAEGSMRESSAGGAFEEVRLRPRVTVAAPDQVEPARALHAEAHARCFIARSVAFPVRHEPTVRAR